MKKLTAFLVVLMMTAVLLLAASAGAEGSEDLFAQLNGKTFDFSSGVGAWDTELFMGENGAFTGDFHDGEMGETGEGYPDGTVYGCLFHGQFSDLQRVDEYTWTAKVALEVDEGQAPEAIEDGIRYVTSTPYGLEKAQTVTIFVPGTPVDRLPEGFLVWSHLQEIDPDAKEIPYYAIWSEADEAGFISDIFADLQQEYQTLAGGWTVAENPAVTEEVQALVSKALEGLMGVNYVPVAYLGSQVVAGTNHAVLCQATVVYPDAQPYYVILYLYQDLQGNVSILNIANFDIGGLCTYGAEAAGE